VNWYRDPVRSYGQYCALARTLDVIGDRWTLLVIRELFARDCRYSDLRDALPGIATNLLADRLRQLQEHGVVESYAAPAPVRASVYRLTARGRDLGPALTALVAWGAPLLTEQAEDAFRTHWMALGLPVLYAGVDVADLAPLEVTVRTGDGEAVLTVSTDGVSMVVGSTPSPTALTVEGPPDQVFALLTGATGPATPGGVTVHGSRAAVRRLRALAERARISSADRPAAAP
jgi:DNA-binding HxlR family transcriptional regulator